MYCPEKLKLNRFKQVQIPSNKDYFSRLGVVATPSTSYTGDDHDVHFPQNKTEEFARIDKQIESDGYRKKIDSESYKK